MPDFSFQVKEAVDLIEERIPGGRWVIRAILTLLLLALSVWAFAFVWRNALVPISGLITSLARGTTLNLKVTLGDVLVWVADTALLISFDRLLRRIFRIMERTLLEQEKGIEIANQHVGITTKLYDRVDALEVRVAKIEEKPN